MKLMLIGMAARGKTTLLERISDKGQRGIQENWGITRWALQGERGGGRGETEAALYRMRDGPVNFECHSHN